mmetsp:Transcript_23881/g.53500  ORF Transcript_23881/g.53500 Transcript_23881/m.53500 type:complete len:305 (-) Transcript_23881:2-916(-)
MCNFCIDECTDDISKSAQGKVNLRRFFEPIARRSCLSLSLRPREIHQVQLPHANMRFATCIIFAAFNHNREDGMRSRAFCIHQGCSDRSVSLSSKHHLLTVLVAPNNVLGEVFHVHSLLHVLLQIQLLARILAQQIAHLLVVDLQVGGPDQERHVSHAINLLEHEGERARCDPSELRDLPHALHGVRLPGPCLSVGKDGPVVPIHDGLADGHAGGFEEIVLFRAWGIHHVEREPLRLLVHFSGRVNSHLAVLFVDLYDHRLLVLNLSRRQRAAPNNHPDSLGFLVHHRDPHHSIGGSFEHHAEA